MTIMAPIPLRHDYEGNNIATKFRYSVEIDDDSFLDVIHTDISGVETTLVLDTDYTITCAGDDPHACGGNGGNVVFPKSGSTFSALAVGERLTILYDALIEQTLSLSDRKRVLNELVEAKLDYIIKLINQAAELHERVLKLAKNTTTPIADTTVPVGASKIFGWDSLAAELILLTVSAVVNTDIITAEGDIVQGGDGGVPEKTSIGPDGALAYSNPLGKVGYRAVGSDNSVLQPSGAPLLPTYKSAPVLLIPTIDDLSKMTHDHTDTQGGGVIPSTAGKYAQIVNVQDSNVATGNTAIPDDDTIPQSNEGDEYMSVTITPTNENNILEIECIFHMAYDKGPSQE